MINEFPKYVSRWYRTLLLVALYYALLLAAGCNKGEEFTSDTPSDPSAPLVEDKRAEKARPNPITIVAGDLTSGPMPATSAVLTSSIRSLEDADTGSFVIDVQNNFYLRMHGGIYIVHHSDGILRRLIATTGRSTGDGGPVESATLTDPLKITLDEKGRLLILDHNLVRRVDPAASPMIIETIIGGGSSVADDAAALDVALEPPVQTHPWPHIFYALPNGYLYFNSDHYGTSSNKDFRVRIYNPDSKRVTSIKLRDSNGAQLTSTQVLHFGLTYDPNTSPVQVNSMQAMFLTNGVYTTRSIASDGRVGAAVTEPYPQNSYLSYSVPGLDGELYAVSRFHSRVSRRQPGGSWEVVLGNGILGQCEDGTEADKCAVDVTDVFVKPDGSLFFMSRGLLRKVAKEVVNGVVTRVVRTVMGVPRSSGDEGKATAARISEFEQIDRTNAGQIILLERENATFREFAINGSIETIAGKGGQRRTAPDSIADASDQSILTTISGSSWDHFVVNPSTGDVFYNGRGHGDQGIGLSRLSRKDGKWFPVVGGGTVNYFTADANGVPGADGRPGSEIRIPKYPPIPIGWDGNNILAVLQDFSNTRSETFLKLYDKLTGTQTHLAGIVGASGADFCRDKTPGATCSVPDAYLSNHTRATYDAKTNRWMLLKFKSNAIRMMNAGRMDTLAILERNAQSFAYVSDPTPGTGTIYYCDTGGRLRRHTEKGDEQLYWPMDSLKCNGRSLLYIAEQNALLTPVVTQEGLYGVAHYQLP